MENVTNEFLSKYLQYTEETEPPKLFHIWAAMATIGACAGRHLWLETGLGPTYLNSYVALVGPPGTRKTAALNAATKLLRDVTDVRLAPKDTGGQRQGLISAIEDKEDEELAEAMSVLESGDEAAMISQLSAMPLKVNDPDKHTMHIAASEWGSIMGQNNLELTRFLLEVWDGEDYSYRLKHSSCSLDKPLLSMLCATTPVDISKILPPEAVGGGFTSRMIFVHASKRYKKIPLSKVFYDTSVVPEIKSVLAEINRKMRGPMAMSNEAAELEEHMYMSETPSVTDMRFTYYLERRHTHMLKLAAAYALSDGRMTMMQRDIEQSNALLAATEKGMPAALGEFGLSKIAVAKQNLLEYLTHTATPLSASFLFHLVRRDMTAMDYETTINEFINVGKVVPVTLKGAPHYMAKQEVEMDLFAI